MLVKRYDLISSFIESSDVIGWDVVSRSYIWNLSGSNAVSRLDLQMSWSVPISHCTNGCNRGKYLRRAVRYLTANLVSSVVELCIYKFANDHSNHKIINESNTIQFDFCINFVLVSSESSGDQTIGANSEGQICAVKCDLEMNQVQFNMIFV